MVDFSGLSLSAIYEHPIWNESKRQFYEVICPFISGIQLGMASRFCAIFGFSGQAVALSLRGNSHIA